MATPSPAPLPRRACRANFQPTNSCPSAAALPALTRAANSWGLAFGCPLVGARLVLPGPFLDGASLHRLMEQEKVTHTAGVPTGGPWVGKLAAFVGGLLCSLPCPAFSVASSCRLPGGFVCLFVCLG